MRKFLLSFFVCFVLFLLFLLTKIPQQQWGSVIVLIVLVALPIGFFAINSGKSKQDDYERHTEYKKQRIRERLKKGNFD